MTPASPQPRIPYPTSGQLVGKAATFLRLKGFLREEDADAPSYRSAQRYFDGEASVTPTIADYIIDRLLLEFLPVDALPAEVRPEGAPPLDWLQATVKEALHRWDGLAGAMNGEAYPLSDRRYAAVPYLRLFTLDLALRWAAYQAIRVKPNEEPVAEPFWLQADAVRVVTDALRTTEKMTLTTSDLAEKAGISLNTLESWRSGNSFPERAEKVAALVTALAKHSGEPRRFVDFRLRVAAAAAGLHRELVGICGDDRIADLIATFSKVVRLAYRVLRFAPIPGEAWGAEMATLVRQGAHAPLGPIVCQKLAEYSLVNQEVQADFLALPGDWEPRLNYWAKRVSELSRFPVEEVRRSGVDAAVAKMVFENLPTLILKMSDFDTKPDDVRLVKLPADAAMKAHAHATQAATAESLGDVYSASEHMRRAVLLQPENGGYQYALGAYLGQLAHAGLVTVREEALAHCRRAQELRPTWDRPPTEIGIILSNAGNFEGAEAHFAHAEPVACDWDHFHYARGMNYLGLRRFEAAVVALRRALELKAYDRRAMVRLGAALAMFGQIDDLPRLAKEIRHRGGPAIRSIDEWRRYADPSVGLDP